MLCCVKSLTPHHKEGIYLNLGRRLLEKHETLDLDSGLWHPGTAGWLRTGNNKGSPSTSKLIFDMPSFGNKMMSSSSPAWSVLPDRKRLLTSHPMGSANS